MRLNDVGVRARRFETWHIGDVYVGNGTASAHPGVPDAHDTLSATFTGEATSVFERNPKSAGNCPVR
jgi:hypothetical protein